MDPNTTAEWCKEQNGQLGLSIVMDIPADKWTEEQIRQAVTTLAPDQKVFVIDTKIDQKVSHTYALLEWKKGVPTCFQGDSIQLAGEVKARLFPLLTSASCLEGPSQTMSDTVEVTTTSVPTTNYPPASFFMDIGKLVESIRKMSSPSVNYGYRKLRISSGVQPVPPGEEEYETWMEQAMQALEEWDVPEAQKKQRITESLKGVAAEAIRNFKFSQESCTAYDYLRMLQDEFGRTEKATDLIFLFEHMFQRETEQLSEYIRRLNKMLYQIVLKKGIEARDMDQVRMKQILRGALSSDPIWIQLKTLQGGTSLRYSDLIKMVREEEAILEEKKKGSGFTVSC
ncbi:paraneoplastic antigen Ma2 homolog [Rana temporaria]|uniref:paraneoplastic antigen Ma2 homolog n=1 Tax=Rana temporaria TaxID=8407 RepID=UPI001AAE0647|nr:paraneoplastic antigen Ma2 homolog [Rana temporaria]